MADTLGEDPQYVGLALGGSCLARRGRVTGCHPKDPNFSQYLSYGMSYASLQAERIPHCKMRRAEGKDQDGDGVSCAEKAVWKGPSATEESVHMPDRI